MYILVHELVKHLVLLNLFPRLYNSVHIFSNFISADSVTWTGVLLRTLQCACAVFESADLCVLEDPYLKVVIIKDYSPNLIILLTLSPSLS